MLNNYQAKRVVAEEVAAYQLLTGETFLRPEEYISKFTLCIEQDEDWKALHWLAGLTAMAVTTNASERHLGALLQAGTYMVKAIQHMEAEGRGATIRTEISSIVPAMREWLSEQQKSRTPDATAQFR